MDLLTKAERLTQEQSRSREKVIALNRKADTEVGLTDEERAELNTHVDRLESIEPEIRGSVAAEAAERAALEEEARTAGPDDGVSPEVRERNELAKKANLGTYLLAAISGRRVDGPEAELRAAFAIGDDAIPMACMDVDHRARLVEEHRAITPSPGTVGISMGMVQPFVFAASIAERLGIEIRGRAERLLCHPDDHDGAQHGGSEGKGRGRRCYRGSAHRGVCYAETDSGKVDPRA